MTQTFTSVLPTATPTEKKPEKHASALAEPSFQTIQNILNYSKSLEIKRSRLVDVIEIVNT